MTDNDVTELRERYFHTLGFDLRGASEKPRLEAALARAYQLRSFEIELYWKRATYFWAFEVAIFAAIGFLWKAAITGELNPVTVALAGLGFLTAVANSISAQGSKFWQQNWEHHIDMLEDAIEGRLYKTVWLRDGRVSFSVSRVNAALSDCFVGFWLLIVVYTVWKLLGSPWGWSDGAYVITVTFLVVIGLLWLFWQRTGFSGTIPNADGNHAPERWPPPRWWHICTRGKPPSFIRRYAPDEDPRFGSGPQHPGVSGSKPVGPDVATEGAIQKTPDRANP